MCSITALYQDYIKDNNNWIQKTFLATSEQIQLYDEKGNPTNKVTKTITEEQNRQAYLAILTPYYTKTQGFGLKMDLSKGIINGYDIMLKGTKSDNTGKTIIIDSSSDTTPLKIGKDFNVNWDGTLTCNKINSLNNDGNDNLAISINDNFYVTKGGGAGGSGCNFGGSFRGGFSGTGIGTFKGTGDFDTLIVGGDTYKKETIYFISTVGLVRDGKNIKLNYFQHNMNVLCSSYTRNPMRSSSASIDHTHDIKGNGYANTTSDSSPQHSHRYYYRNGYTEGIK